MWRGFVVGCDSCFAHVLADLRDRNCDAEAWKGPTALLRRWPDRFGFAGEDVSCAGPEGSVTTADMCLML